jgi:hypothetical protein
LPFQILQGVKSVASVVFKVSTVRLNRAPLATHERR